MFCAGLTTRWDCIVLAFELSLLTILQVNKYFGEEGEKSSRFGFLQKVDCDAAVPMLDCR